MIYPTYAELDVSFPSWSAALAEFYRLDRLQAALVYKKGFGPYYVVNRQRLAWPTTPQYLAAKAAADAAGGRPYWDYFTAWLKMRYPNEVRAWSAQPAWVGALSAAIDIAGVVVAGAGLVSLASAGATALTAPAPATAAVDTSFGATGGVSVAAGGASPLTVGASTIGGYVAPAVDTFAATGGVSAAAMGSTGVSLAGITSGAQEALAAATPLLKAAMPKPAPTAAQGVTPTDGGALPSTGLGGSGIAYTLAALGAFLLFKIAI